MSWLFSRALVEEYSAPSSSDGEPSAPLSVMPTQHKFWHNGKTMDCSNLSRFGLTCRVLTENFGAELLMSYLAAFHARTSASQGKVPASKVNAADSGRRWPGLLARYDRDSCSWKTVQPSLLGDSDEFLETWPRWGSMRNGESYLRRIPALPICASESGLWQTPVADDAIERVKGKYNSRGEPKLSAQVKLAPTPVASDTGFRKERYAQGGTALSTFVGGHLNPDWEEWLMGWPIGWSALEPLATGKYHEWLQQHGAYSAAEEKAA